MKKGIVYDIASGRIVKCVTIGDTAQLMEQVRAGQSVIEGEADDRTHRVIDGEVVERLSPEPIFTGEEKRAAVQDIIAARVNDAVASGNIVEAILGLRAPVDGEAVKQAIMKARES